MAVRATQAVVASLSIANLAHTQATQLIVNVLTIKQTYTNVRATQLAADVLRTGSHVRATQLAAGVLRAGSHVRATQISLSILVWNHAPLILVLNDGVLMPAVYPTLPGLTYSVIKRPKWFTGIGTSASGREVRVGYAANPLWEWDLSYEFLRDYLSPSELKTLMGFYLSQAGNLNGFLFLDPDDHCVTGQVLGTTDGVATTWTLQRTFGGSDGSGTEPIGYVNTGAAFNVYLGGALADPSTYDLLTTTPVNQQVRFHAAPASGQVITVDMTYYYYVRFKDDHYDFEKFMNNLWSLQTVTLMSQRG